MSNPTNKRPPWWPSAEQKARAWDAHENALAARKRAAENLNPAVRAKLAEYHVLAAYDRHRSCRYGDMAGTRRGRELDRRGDELVDLGVPVRGAQGFPPSTPAELGDAWVRVALPRIRRVERESFRHGTKYTRATLAAWRATGAEVNPAGLADFTEAPA